MSPNFTKITPSLPVTSIPASIEYYTTILGFRIAGRDGDNHTWLQLRSTDDDDDDDDNNTDDKHRVPVNIYLRREFPSPSSLFFLGRQGKKKKKAHTRISPHPQDAHSRTSRTTYKREKCISAWTGRKMSWSGCGGGSWGRGRWLWRRRRGLW
jgi:hypothetical protein